MVRRALLPNLITTFSLACGLFVIFKMSMVTPGQASYPVLLASTLLLLVASIADALDGATARKMGAESDFGLLFDSLSDAITFGVAPAVLTLKSISVPPEEKLLGMFVATAAMLYAICAVLRLVRYSISKSDEESIFFTGLPTPAAAGGVVSATLLLASPQFHSLVHLSELARTGILMAVLATLGYLMVSRWPFPGPKILQLRMWSYPLLVAVVAGAAALFYGILHWFPITLAVIVWGYLCLAWISALYRMILERRLA